MAWRTLVLGLLVVSTLVELGCSAEPSTVEPPATVTHTRPSFMTQDQGGLQYLNDIVSNANAINWDAAWKAFAAWQYSYLTDYGNFPTYAEYLEAVGDGGTPNNPSPPSPDSLASRPKPLEPFSTFDNMCPVRSGRRYVCFDIYIAATHVGPFMGDNRTADALATAAHSRAQIVIDLDDPNQNSVTLSKSCLAGVLLYSPPTVSQLIAPGCQDNVLQPPYNYAKFGIDSVSTPGVRNYTVAYHFLDAYSAANRVNYPAIQGVMQFQTNSAGTPALQQVDRVNFPSLSIYSFDLRNGSNSFTELDQENDGTALSMLLGAWSTTYKVIW